MEKKKVTHSLIFILKYIKKTFKKIYFNNWIEIIQIIRYKNETFPKFK